MDKITIDYVGKSMLADVAAKIGKVEGTADSRWDKQTLPFINSKGKASGLATLDENGMIPAEQLGNIDLSLFKVVSVLPSTLSDIDPKLIYLVSSDDTGSQNMYKEYVYTGDTTSKNAKYDASKWEQFGEYHATFDAMTSSVKVSDTIPVAGGPLADLLNDADIDSIPADMTMQQLLKLLFTQEVWPSISYTEGKPSVALANPSFTLNSGTSNILCEVGTVVNIGAFTPTAATTAATNSVQSGFTYGYKEGDTTSEATSITKALTGVALSGSYTVTRKIGSTTESTKSDVNISNVALAATTYTATAGSVNVVVSITSPTVTATAPAFGSVYIVSNLKNTSDDHKTTAINSKTVTGTAATKSVTHNITGVYPIYATTSKNTELTKQALSTATTYTLAMVEEDDTNRQRFAVPASKTVSSVTMLNTLSNQYENFALSNFTVTTESMSCGPNKIDYKVYTRNTTTAGACTMKINIA